MITIKCKDLTTGILTDDIEDIKKLSDAFKFRPEGYFYMPAYKAGIWDGWIRPISAVGQFSKGLYTTIMSKCDELGIEYTLDQESFNYLNLELDLLDYEVTNEKGDTITPFEYQLNAVKHILDYKTCIIESPTGSGKSLIQYLLCRNLLDYKFNRILIVVPNVSLVSQMTSDFCDYSSADDSFDGEDSIHKITAGADKQTEKPIVISTWQSLQNIKDKSYFKQFDAVLVDECHTAKAKQLTKIVESCTNGIIKVGFSGTLEDCKINRYVLLGLFGDVYKTNSIKQLMNKDILSDLIINVILLKHDVDMPLLPYKDEIDFLVSNNKRNNFILNLTKVTNGNTLILYELVEKHGKVLYKLIKEQSPDKDVYIIHGGIKAEERERIRKITETKDDVIIIASYKTFQQGINIKRLHNVIFASPSKSKIRVFQSIGRSLRKHSTKDCARLYDIADDLRGNKKALNHTLRHFKQRVEMYAKEQLKLKIKTMEL